MIRLSAFALLALALSPAAVAQQNVTNLSYTCNLDGMAAQLTAQVQAVGDAGIVQNGHGDITGVIGTGDYNLRYAGQLVSQTARYVFTGENAFADFTDMVSGARFHVQFVAQGNQLLLIANPEGPQPVRYLCQSNTAGRPQ